MYTTCFSGNTFIISSSKDKNFRHCMQTFDNIRDVWRYKGLIRMSSIVHDQNVIYCSWSECHLLFMIRMSSIVHDQNVIYCSWSECHILFMIRMSSIVHYQNVIYCSWILIDSGKFITKWLYPFHRLQFLISHVRWLFLSNLSEGGPVDIFKCSSRKEKYHGSVTI